ncbi:MAG TPA: hypothetical protein DEV81_04415 [Cyanobacteria bacterium UBA11049]|nr:hypothetical protein [Cyanobacteria bacterium UBA11049]
MRRKQAVFFRTLYSLLKLDKSPPHQVLLLVLVLSQSIFGLPVMPAATTTLPASEVGREAALQLGQGRQYYETGQFAAAASFWSQAATAFASLGDRLNQAMVLNNLSLAYQQLGQLSEAKKATDTSLKLLQTGTESASKKEYMRILAQALNTQGSLQLALGESEPALATWQQAATAYDKAGDRTGFIRSSINSAQALRALGLYRRALTTLIEVNEIQQKQPDSLIKVAGLRSLGTTLQLIGEAGSSRQVLQNSLALAQKLESPADISATLLSLGNTARSQEDAKAALAFYDRSATQATDATTKLQAQLNSLSLLIDRQELSAAQALLPQIKSEIANLPASRNTVYAKINFAQSLMKLETRGQGEAEGEKPLTSRPLYIAQLLAQAVKQAKSLKDQRAEAYGLGNLGKIYQQTQQLSSAQDLTQQALILAQAIHAPDIAYNWQWQLGRLQRDRGDITGAIATYTEAVKTLQSLRSDLVAINPDVQFSFRESVEPVYRELVSLLLRKSNREPTQENLALAREAIESLQLAELDNFFKEACLDTKPVQLDSVNAQAAVIYPIILTDRLEVILSLPGQPLRHYATSIPQSQLESTIEQFRQNLVIRSKREFIPVAQKLYDWLIRPVEADLAKSGVKTLVFVADGALRNIPMAALRDRHQYLIEKYSIALAPSLKLLDPKPLQRRQLKALTVGLSEARQGFAPLSNVPLELKQIQSEVSSVVLLNQKFTSNAFQNQIESTIFPIVHIATHGQFSSKAEQTFILSWDDRINVKQLDRILQPRNKSNGAIELLVLSACQTAAGDKRAALGLAGIAVRAGARSTLATLWSVDDAATAELMNEFYRELANTTLTKAEALRRAQLKLIKNPQAQHPIYWAAYVLVGNWL